MILGVPETDSASQGMNQNVCLSAELNLEVTASLVFKLWLWAIKLQQNSPSISGNDVFLFFF